MTMLSMGEKRLFRVLEFPKHLQTTLVTLLKLGRLPLQRWQS